MILVITDNLFIFEEFKKITFQPVYKKINFDYRFSKNNTTLINKKYDDFMPIDLKKDYIELINKYELIISLHCKQIFPSELVNNIRCINIHPGLNPYNRGWFPQVFSIINKFPIGVTIHEMDEQLNHGPIIIQKELKIYDWETSYDVYKRILLLEIELLRENLVKIIYNDYKAYPPNLEGNLNYKKDFAKLCEIDLDKKVTYREAIEYLRAMSFKGYKNAYFYDEDGNKIFVEIELEVGDMKDE